MLAAIGKKELPIPDHFDIFHLHGEIEASDKTALMSVMEVDEERHRLEIEAEELAHLGEEGHERYKYYLIRLISNIELSNTQTVIGFIVITFKIKTRSVFDKPNVK